MTKERRKTPRWEVKVTINHTICPYRDVHTEYKPICMYEEKPCSEDICLFKVRNNWKSEK